jgi:hypothetical protein
MEQLESTLGDLEETQKELSRLQEERAAERAEEEARLGVLEELKVENATLKEEIELLKEV